MIIAKVDRYKTRLFEIEIALFNLTVLDNIFVSNESAPTL